MADRMDSCCVLSQFPGPRWGLWEAVQLAIGRLLSALHSPSLLGFGHVSFFGTVKSSVLGLLPDEISPENGTTFLNYAGAL